MRALQRRSPRLGVAVPPGAPFRGSARCFALRPSRRPPQRRTRAQRKTRRRHRRPSPRLHLRLLLLRAPPRFAPPWPRAPSTRPRPSNGPAAAANARAALRGGPWISFVLRTRRRSRLPRTCKSEDSRLGRMPRAGAFCCPVGHSHFGAPVVHEASGGALGCEGPPPAHHHRRPQTQPLRRRGQTVC